MAKIAALQSVASANAGATGGTTTAGITTVGNLQVALMWTFTNTIGATPITDSKGNTWVQAIPSTGGTECWGAMYYCAGGTVGAGHTFTATATATDFVVLLVIDIENALVSDPLNGTAAASSNANGSPRVSGNISANEGVNELFVGGIGTMRAAQGQPLINGTPWFGLRAILPSAINGGCGGGVRYADSGLTDQFSATLLANANFTTVMVAGFKEDASLGGGGSGVMGARIQTGY